jgi:hypothetical protein
MEGPPEGSGGIVGAGAVPSVAGLLLGQDTGQEPPENAGGRMIDFWLTHGPLGPGKERTMTLREAARAVVAANRARTDFIDLEEFTKREVEFQIALAELERMTSEGAPLPGDLAKMMGGA